MSWCKSSETPVTAGVRAPHLLTERRVIVMQGSHSMGLNEKKHVLREYAYAKSAGDSARAAAIRDANGKWLTAEDFATAKA